MKRNKAPQAWQRDPQNIETDKVQFWSSGIMVTAQLSKKDAQMMVEQGGVFVINAQAVGAMNGRDHSLTCSAVGVTGAVTTTPFGYTTSTQADAIVTLVNRLRLDLVSLGLIKGS